MVLLPQLPEGRQSSPLGLLLPPHLLPSILYCALLSRHQSIGFATGGSYVKQSYLNRCHILTSTGVRPLVVPVRRGSHRQQLSGAEIDYSTPWASRLCHTLATAYGKSPYYAEFVVQLFPCLQSKHGLLLELNLALLGVCWGFMGAGGQSGWYPSALSHPLEQDGREWLHPKKPLPAPYSHMPPYRQLFGKRFYPGLSIVDLIFCEGPAALGYLAACAV